MVYLTVVLVPAAVAAKCGSEENETSSLLETGEKDSRCTYTCIYKAMAKQVSCVILLL